jgi:hypothetical protein
LPIILVWSEVLCHSSHVVRTCAFWTNETWWFDGTEWEYCILEYITFMIWLVAYLPLWKIMEFVSWDDEIPNWMESHTIPWFQTTNQFLIGKIPLVSMENHLIFKLGKSTISVGHFDRFGYVWHRVCLKMGIHWETTMINYQEIP